MNLELFIARRLLEGSKKMSVSVPIVKIALVGIALGVSVILMAIFIITGFKREITEKLTGFSSHINVVTYGNKNYYGEGKLNYSADLYKSIHEIDEVKEAYGYVNKPSILKSKDEIHGVLLYGVDSAYKKDFIHSHLKEGEMPDFSKEQVSNDIVISAFTGRQLKVGVGDKLEAHFVQDPPRVRAFTVRGIYDTGFKEYDDLFVLCDIRHLQRLNDWENGEVSGIAMKLYDINQIPQVVDKLESVLPWEEEEGVYYKVKTIYDMSPQIFDWLELLNMNVWVIMVLLVIVAGFNMVSGLFILILDKTTLIGMLKALGYKNINLRKFFMYISAGLIGKGVLWGNLLAFVLGWLQYQFNIIHLDPSVYYMDTVPLGFNVGYILLLDAGVILVSILMLIVPTMLISKINPIKAIRFE